MQRWADRQMKVLRVFVAAVLVPIVLPSCATIVTLSEDETKNKVYSGTLRHIDLKCGHAVCLDFPFSLVTDTLLLPLTIPWSLINLIKSTNGKSEQSGGASNPTVERDTPKAAR